MWLVTVTCNIVLRLSFQQRQCIILAFNNAFYQKLGKMWKFLLLFSCQWLWLHCVNFFWYCRHQLLPQISQLLSGVEGIPEIWRQTGRPCIPRLVCSLRQVILCYEPTSLQWVLFFTSPPLLPGASFTLTVKPGQAYPPRIH